MGEELGDVDDEGVVVGTGEPEELGGEDDAASCERGVNRAPGVVMYRGCVIGSAGDTDEGWSSSETGPTLGRLLGCAISFHTLGLSV